MQRRILALGVLCLVTSFVSTTRLVAEEATPVSASPPKPLDLKTYQNRAFDAYTQALAEGKYTLLLFSYNHKVNGFAQRMEKKLTDPYLAIYSAYFIAAITEDRDEGGRHLAKALNIQRYPTVIVLKTDLDRLHVVGRIEGVFEAEAIDKVLRESLKAPEGRESVDSRDKT